MQEQQNISGYLVNMPKYYVSITNKTKKETDWRDGSAGEVFAVHEDPKC